MSKRNSIKVLKVCDDFVTIEKLNCKDIAVDCKYNVFTSLVQFAKPSDENFEYFMPVRIGGMEDYYVYFGEECLDHPNKIALNQFKTHHYGNIYIVKKTNRCSLLNYSFRNIKEKDFENIVVCE